MATAFIGIDHHNNGGGFWASALVPGVHDEEGKSFSLVHEACSPLYCKGNPDWVTTNAIDKWGDSDGFYYQNFTESEVESLQRACRDYRFSKEEMEWNEVQKWVPYAEELFNRLTRTRNAKLLNGDESHSARGRNEYYTIGHPFFLLVQLDSTIHALRTLKEETRATEAVIVFQLPWNNNDREGAPNTSENWTDNDSLLIPLTIATAAKVVFRHKATVIPLPKLLATSNGELVFGEGHLEDSYSSMLMSIYAHAYCTDTVGLSTEKLLDESYKQLKVYCKKHSYTGHEFK